jgi:hypothetical protein
VRAGSAVLLAAAALLAGACAKARPPSPAVVSAARTVATYSAVLSVKLGFRVRADVIVAFRRPDRLRLEVPGPAGARLLLTAREGRLTAVFPGERAIFEGPASERILGEVVGVALTPGDVMDFLVGTAPASVRGYRADWGPALPRRLRGRLPDGTRLDLRVLDPRTEAADDRAFEPPPHDGYRAVDTAEARALWTGK